MNKLDEMVEMAKELEANVRKLEKEDKVAAERKMRFAANESGLPVSGLWLPSKPSYDHYGLEELALGRMLLNARGEVLPDDLEVKFQSLADQAHKHTMTTGGTGTGAELTDVVAWDQLFQDIQGVSISI